jgi:hypothetical protein
VTGIELVSKHDIQKFSTQMNQVKEDLSLAISCMRKTGEGFEKGLINQT